MKVRRFTGATMQQALRQVKATLGRDAVILDTVEGAGQVTITAAVDAGPELTAGAVGDGELVLEVRRMLGVVGELVDEHWRRRLPGLGPELLRLHRALVGQGVDGVIAAALVRETAERLEPGAPLDTALARALGTVRPPAEAERVRLLFGPPGDGKTTTIAKLAARALRAGRRVALVGTDTYRVGALAELETYGRALGIPVVAAPHTSELSHALATAGDADLVLVDTAGAAAGPELAELAVVLEAAGQEAGRTLVLSAATSSTAAWQTWQAFAPLRPDACVVTKCDVAPGGPVLGLLWRRGVPVSHVATGRRIAADLEPATPDRLARCLLAA
jgi:flagellar biosynthesis protein FlhF